MINSCSLLSNKNVVQIIADLEINGKIHKTGVEIAKEVVEKTKVDTLKFMAGQMAHDVKLFIDGKL